MPLLFSMSLFGTIATLFYIILESFAKKYFSTAWRKVYLICNILCFVFPFFYFIAVDYRIFLSSIFKKILPQEPVDQIAYEDFTGDIIQITKQGIYMEDAYIYVFLIGSVIVGLILLYCQFRKYQKIKRHLSGNKKTIQKVGNIRILKCDMVDTPFTMGVLKPIIVLPDVDWKSGDLEYVIEHEMTHIKQKDNLIKMLLLVMLAMHFYNPFVYYVLHKWGVIAELVCDEKVLAGKTKEEVKRYGLLVISLAQEHTEHRLIPVMGFNMQNKEMEERIRNMKKGQKKVKPLMRMLGVGMMGMAMMLSSLSVYAYDWKDVWFLEEPMDYIYYWEDSSYLDTLLPPVAENGEWLFIEEDGTIIGDIDDEYETSTYAICQHNYVSGGIATQHNVNAKGGCTTKVYDVKRCSKCGVKTIGNCISTTTMESCTH